MEILKPAMAGTLESSDAQVMVEPGEGGIELTLESSVMNHVENARVAVVDKGALDCTIKARVECAVFRSCGQSAENIPWGGAIR